MRLLGAVLTPTDPVLAGAIVTGRLAKEKLPGPLRALLSGESGANDGLAYPLVLLPILMLGHASAGEALREWFTHTWLWEVGFAVLAGLAIGALAGGFARLARTRAWLGESSDATLSAATALLAISAVKLLGSDGILAASDAVDAAPASSGNARP